MKGQRDQACIKGANEKYPCGHAGWDKAVLWAIPIALFLLGLFYYWFAVADRYIVFLYNHDMGPLYPDTSPFSRVTSSRYWMAGLVASGALMVLHVAASWTIERLFPNHRSPEWWQVWVVCALVLGVGIPAITMRANNPTLPARHAAQVTLVTVLGLWLALQPSRLAAKRPGEMLWLTADGLGVAIMLQTFIHMEKARHWLARSLVSQLWIIAASLTIGVTWLLAVTNLRIRLRRRIPCAGTILAAGACIAYLLMPLVHYLVGTNGYYYISDSDNFFAQNTVVQLAAWLMSGALALGLTWLRHKLATRRMGLRR